MGLLVNEWDDLNEWVCMTWPGVRCVRWGFGL